MSLNHVVLWTNGGYAPVAPSYIRANYSSAERERLRLYCELCKEKVEAVCWGAIQAPHFRHTKNSKTKECEDRSAAYERERFEWALNPRQREFPIRVKIAESGEWAKFELLLPSPPRSFVDANRGATVALSWRNSFGRQERRYFLSSLLGPIDVGIVYRRQGKENEGPGASYVIGLEASERTPPSANCNDIGGSTRPARFRGLRRTNPIFGLTRKPASNCRATPTFWRGANIGC